MAIMVNNNTVWEATPTFEHTRNLTIEYIK